MDITTAFRPRGNHHRRRAFPARAGSGQNNGEYPLTIAKSVDTLFGNYSLEGGS